MQRRRKFITFQNIEFWSYIPFKTNIVNYNVQKLTDYFREYKRKTFSLTFCKLYTVVFHLHTNAYRFVNHDDLYMWHTYKLQQLYCSQKSESILKRLQFTDVFTMSRFGVLCEKNCSKFFISKDVTCISFTYFGHYVTHLIFCWKTKVQVFLLASLSPSC